MTHGAPRDPNDYPCHCPACEPPDPRRDFFAEAVAIAAGDGPMLPQKEHLIAVLDRLDDAEVANRKGKPRLPLSMLLATFEGLQPPGSPYSIRDQTIATARAQAASVTGPRKDELLESLRAAERATKPELSAEEFRACLDETERIHGASMDTWSEAHDELAREEAENKIIVAQEGSL
ncbi:MAG: hypothetical protein V1790_17430 [Planctomycetota bacterium]